MTDLSAVSAVSAVSTASSSGFDVGALIRRVDAFLDAEQAANPLIADIERAAPQDLELGASHRWYVRMTGEEKAVVTVWMTVRERTLHYETYVCPAPAENIAEAYEYFLRVNKRLTGMSFCIGGEDALFLQGQIALVDVDEIAIDRILGSLYAASEETFPTAMRIGHTSLFVR
jgi:Putative bacterial sensory transduction regulator